MSKAIYIALSGAVLRENHLEIISQNLANSNTLGYKKVKLAFKDHLINPEISNNDKVMSSLAMQATDFSMGGLNQTGNPLDVALTGKGFIALEGNKYTRRGDLKIDEKGILTTQTGNPVLGSNGPIRISNGKVEIGLKGEVIVNKNSIDTIKLVDFPDRQALVRIGDDLFQTDQKSNVPVDCQLKQGYLESSNVEIVREMTRLITTLREFQAFQKIIQGMDEATIKMSEIARI